MEQKGRHGTGDVRNAASDRNGIGAFTAVPIAQLFTLVDIRSRDVYLMCCRREMIGCKLFMLLHAAREYIAARRERQKTLISVKGALGCMVLRLAELPIRRC